jgi:hypothetical protein
MIGKPFSIETLAAKGRRIFDWSIGDLPKPEGLKLIERLGTGR